MRYFIAKNQSNVIVEKQCLAGDDNQINNIVANYQSNHPAFTIAEVDQPTFDATVMPVVQTQAQKDWTTFKVGPPVPTALQGVLYLAKFLGLE